MYKRFQAIQRSGRISFESQPQSAARFAAALNVPSEADRLRVIGEYLQRSDSKRMENEEDYGGYGDEMGGLDDFAAFEDYGMEEGESAGNEDEQLLLQSLLPSDPNSENLKISSVLRKVGQKSLQKIVSAASDLNKKPFSEE